RSRRRSSAASRAMPESAALFRPRLSPHTFLALAPHRFQHLVLDDAPDVVGEIEKLFAAFYGERPRPGDADFHDLADLCRPRREDHHAIGEKNRFVDLVGDEDDRLL